MFPLWGTDQDPFLRSIVRPTFGLKKNTLTRLFTYNNKPFWKPFTQDRWIIALIQSAKQEVEINRASLHLGEESQFTEQQIKQASDYLKRLKGLRERHAVKIKNTNDIYNLMKHLTPDEAEKFYNENIATLNEQLEEALVEAAGQLPVIEEYERKLKQALLTRGDVFSKVSNAIENESWDEIQEQGKEWNLTNLLQLASAGRVIKGLEQELKGLSVAERNAPAYGFEMPPHHPLDPHRQVVAMPFEAKRPTGLVSPSTKNARQIVCIDPDFFRLYDDGQTIRILAVEWQGRHELRYDQASKNLLDEIWKTLNWRKLSGFVK
ncbi:MAG: hypothetical protein ACLFNU_12105 [Bacteroidales bacterium]